MNDEHKYDSDSGLYADSGFISDRGVEGSVNWLFIGIIIAIMFFLTVIGTANFSSTKKNSAESPYSSLRRSRAELQISPMEQEQPPVQTDILGQNPEPPNE